MQALASVPAAEEVSACSDKARKSVTSSLFHEFRVRDSGLQCVLRPVKHDRSGSLPSVPNQLASNWTARLDNSVIAVGGKLDEVTAMPGLLEFLGSEKTEILNAFNDLSAGCGRVDASNDALLGMRRAAVKPPPSGKIEKRLPCR